ncbi:unnamed protein product [Aureobasidium uvarum]|uniref:Uncharacterized protein n=1 Tax=Aureobasidium uvarum TaxID=2773716 RepID=A0A9N8KI74_9PEZI|nr:unnamed protein product [Aureobasidium uvarum]
MVDEAWKLVYNQMRQRRCSSSTISTGAHSTPSPPRSSDPLEDMRHILAPEPDYGEDVLQLEVTMEQLWEFMDQINTDGSDDFLKTNHLKLVINSSDFGDWEDDSCIYIKGTNLFTRHNYVKPEITIQEEVPLPVKGKGKGVDADLGPYNSAPAFDGNNEGAAKKPKFTRSSMNSTANADFIPPSLTTLTADTSSKRGPSYTTKKIPSPKINIHVYEKAIIPAIIDMFANRDPPLAFITIQGPMQLSLRRHIISSINPGYMSSLSLLTEAGHHYLDNAAVHPVELWEAHNPEVTFLKRGIQDPEDFGQWRKHSLKDCNMHGLGEWIVPSGKGARGIWGWRVNAPGVKVWRGPSTSWVGREGI